MASTANIDSINVPSKNAAQENGSPSPKNAITKGVMMMTPKVPPKNHTPQFNKKVFVSNTPIINKRVVPMAVQIQLLIGPVTKKNFKMLTSFSRLKGVSIKQETKKAPNNTWAVATDARIKTGIENWDKEKKFET